MAETALLGGMGEAAVIILLKNAQKLCEKAQSLGNVPKEVEEIKNHLDLINPYIKDADDKQEDDVKIWVNELRKVAFRMEDVVDHYLLEVTKRDRRHGVHRAVTKCKCNPKILRLHRHIASDIKKIRTDIDNLRKNIEFLRLIRSPVGLSSPNTPPIPRLAAPFVDEVIGIESYKRELTDWLLTKSDSHVMVVLGPEWIGKTTIVKNVYNSCNGKKEKNNMQNQGRQLSNFKFCAWITMSRSQFDHQNVLIEKIKQNILEEDPEGSSALRSETTNSDRLVTKIKDYLTDKSYLMVFDDVQENQCCHVENVIKLLIKGNKSSKVIITTRDKSVASIIATVISVKVRKVEVEPLSQHDALKLFRQKAFQFDQQEQYPNLNDLSEKFVMKCNGVPLLIVTVAGLLSTKGKTPTEWQKVLDELGSKLQTDPFFEFVKQTMLGSYKDLPSHLKQCFLYFALFPEGYSISRMRLIRLWVAEGFVIKGDTDKTSMEEFAEEYLDELIRRCMVHVSRVDFDGRPKSCHVYDLTHKLIAEICKEQMFCESIKNAITPSNSVPRRLSIIKKNDNATMRRAQEWKKVRSCFVFDDDKKWLVNKHFFSSFKLLVRLDLSNALLENLPEEVEKLLNLKYLSLRNTNIKNLPKSIGKLVNLETLDLKQTQVLELPVEIKNLIKLRHLLAYYNTQCSYPDCLQGVKLNEGIQYLTSLQKLSFLDASDRSIIEELEHLRMLRKLGIIKINEQHGEALWKAIKNMNHLCSLSIGVVGNHGMLLQSRSSDQSESIAWSRTLQRLYLYGRLERLPKWISELPNLNRLYLKWSNLKEDPLPYLKDLPELLYLELHDTYEGNELHFKNGWLKLKVLFLGLLPKLKTIKIDKGAIPCLAELKIGKCREMMQVPRDIQNLKSLQKLYLYDMNEDFIKRMGDQRCEDHMIINRIPLVEYSNGDHFVTLHHPDP